MKALRFSRSLPRFAAARVAGSVAPGGGARVGPLALVEAPDPREPGPGWQRVQPILAGICGADLATGAGESSRYFEPLVSVPFVPGRGLVAVLGTGTLGLCVVAALRRFTLPGTVIAGAKHPDQRREALRLGADVAVVPAEVKRAVRRAARCLTVGERLSGGADVVIDCVGNAASIHEALAITRPRRRGVPVGLPRAERPDLAAPWPPEAEPVR